MIYSDLSEERKEKKREAARKWKENNKLRRAAYQMNFKYSITWDDFVELLESQQYRCAIRDRELSLPGNKNNAVETAHVDHCHTTGKVRGLLCKTCNRAIGLLKDDPVVLNKAAQYIERNTSANN